MKKSISLLVTVSLLILQQIALADESGIIRVGLYGDSVNDTAYNIRQTADGGYIIAGSVEPVEGNRNWQILKLKQDFSPDTSFGDNGKLVLGTSGEDQAIDVIEVLDKKGKPDGFLVVGHIWGDDGDFANHGYRGKIDIALVRLRPDGKLDHAFGQHGIALIGGSDDDEVIVHLHNYSEPGSRIVQRGDRFTIGAMTRSHDGDLEGVESIGESSGRDVMAFQVDRQGRLIRTFGDKGFLRIETTAGLQEKQDNGSSFLFSIKPFGNDGYITGGYTLGKEVVVDGYTIRTKGNRDDQGANDLKGKEQPYLYKMDGMFIRFDEEGKLVREWGDHGIVFVGGTRHEKMYDVSVGTNGIYLTGRTCSYDIDLRGNTSSNEVFSAFVTRLDMNGKIDPAFGAYGSKVWHSYNGMQARLVYPLDDGRVVVLVGRSSLVPVKEDTPVDPADFEHEDDTILGGSLVLLASDGTVLKTIRFGGTGRDAPVGMIRNREGNFVITGLTDSTNGTFSGLRSHGMLDIFVLELDLL